MYKEQFSFKCHIPVGLSSKRIFSYKSATCKITGTYVVYVEADYDKPLVQKTANPGHII
jgi:hypothetical protein